MLEDAPWCLLFTQIFVKQRKFLVRFDFEGNEMWFSCFFDKNKDKEHLPVQYLNSRDLTFNLIICHFNYFDRTNKFYIKNYK